MNLKQRMRERALELGFDDIGFTTAEPLDLYLKEAGDRVCPWSFYFLNQCTVSEITFIK